MCIKFDTWFKSKYINIMSANAWKVVISAFSYLTTVTFIYDIRELSPQHPQIVSSAFVHSCVHFLHGKMTIKRSKCLYACFLCISAYNLNYYILCYSSRCYWCTLKDFLIMSPTSIHLFLKTFLQPRDHIVPLAGLAETSLPVCLGGTEGMSVVGSAGLLASSPGSGAGGRSLYASLFGIRRGGGGAGTDISSSSDTKQ